MIEKLKLFVKSGVLPSDENLSNINETSIQNKINEIIDHLPQEKEPKCKEGYGEHDYCVMNTKIGKLTCCNCGKLEPTKEVVEFNIQSTDAKVWAKEFMRLYWEKNPKQFHYIDEALMISWFANAIMAGYDEATRRAKEPTKEVPDIREIFEKLIIDHYWDSLNTEKEMIIKHFVEGILPLAINQISALYGKGL